MGLALRSRRGQVTLLALVAVAVTLFVVAYMMFQQEQTENVVRYRERNAKLIQEKTEQLRTILGFVVEESVFQAVTEIAETGGFTAENAPSPNHMGVPLLVDRGNVINFPTDRTLERMLRQELRRRLESNLFDMGRLERYGITRIELDGELLIGEDDLVLGDNYVSYTANIPVIAEMDGVRAVLREPVTVELPLRLMRLARLARAFAELYTKPADRLGLDENPWHRELEMLVSYLMAHDQLLPEASSEAHVPVQPFLLEPNLGRAEAERTRGYCTLCRDVTYPFTEIRREVGKDVLVGATMFSTKASSERFQRVIQRVSGSGRSDEELARFMRGVEWEFVPLIGDAETGFASLGLTLNGLTNDLLVQGRPPEEISCPDPQCECCKWYKASYQLRFPVEVQITDLLPTGSVQGSSTVMRPLQFRFMLRVELGKESPFSTDLSPAALHEPREYDVSCEGHCSVRIRPVGVDAATVAIAPCLQELSFVYDANEMDHIDTGLGVPCGVREVIITPNDTEHFGTARERVQVPSPDVVHVEVPRYRHVTGRVLANTTIQCIETRRLACLDHKFSNIVHGGPCTHNDTDAFEPLEYIPGAPPSYVSLTLVPLDPGRDRLEVSSGEGGRYSFDRVLPGRYLFLAAPNVDTAGNIGHKVQTWAEVLVVTDDLKQDIIMQPVFTANVAGTYTPIYEQRRCGS